MTRLLCETLEATPDTILVDMIYDGVDGLRDWHEQHIFQDRLRRQREAADELQTARRQRAIEKLTPEERSLLGLDR